MRKDTVNHKSQLQRRSWQFIFSHEGTAPTTPPCVLPVLPVNLLPSCPGPALRVWVPAGRCHQCNNLVICVCVSVSWSGQRRRGRREVTEADRRGERTKGKPWEKAECEEEQTREMRPDAMRAAAHQRAPHRRDHADCKCVTPRRERGRRDLQRLMWPRGSFLMSSDFHRKCAKDRKT